VKKVKLEILGLSESHTSKGAYALVLGESGGNRRLPIIIGGGEAQSIAIGMENIPLTRPLSHDLFKTFAEGFNITVTEVIIYKIIEGLFFSKIIANNVEQTVEVDARTSDAIAIAIRFGAPIYTYDTIIASYGIVFEDEPSRIAEMSEEPVEEDSTDDRSGFSRATVEELDEWLQNAIDEEDYERASRIRDELKKRSS
jgi:uncharacterized protein